MMLEGRRTGYDGRHPWCHCRRGRRGDKSKNMMSHIWLACAFILPQVCGSQSIGAQPAPSESQQFQSRIDEAARGLAGEPSLKRLSEEQRQSVVEFVAGNMLFVLLHEMAHVLVTEMGLPVLGREEDAADAFATVTLLKLGTAFSHRVLVEAAQGWFLSDKRDRWQRLTLTFYDAHGLDKQRAYQIVCLMVGSNPEQFGDLADETGLPEDRQQTCMGDYSNASWSWNKVLEPHRRSEEPKTNVAVIYGDGKHQFDVYARSLRSIRLLETVVDHAVDQFVWRKPFTVQIQSCGNVNADWDITSRKLTLCYEMAQDFARLYRDYGQERKARGRDLR
jgi:hypothetical protein